MAFNVFSLDFAKNQQRIFIENMSKIAPKMGFGLKNRQIQG